MNREERLSFFADASHDGQSPRLWGIYPQRQEGLYMQRAKTRSGRLSPAQLRALAEISRRFTPEYPLHLTTRQDIEFHGVRIEDIRAVQKKIKTAGLSCIGACGDSVRNITLCPGAGICPESGDIAPVADAVREALEALPFIQNLPRKFKISFSACEKACAAPFVNDLAFVLHSDGTYSLLGAGSIGSPPRTGMVLSSRLLGIEVVAAATAAARLFYRLGDRKKRHAARLRHARERLGDEAFLEQFHDEFRHALKVSAIARPIVLPDRNGFSQVTRLRIPHGDLLPDHAAKLADAVEQAQGEFRIDLEHGVWLVTKRAVQLPVELQRMENLPSVISCPGSSLCSRGMTGCRNIAQAVSEKVKVPEGICVKISGCPNNCSHAAVADIGLIGRVKSLNGARTECYRLVAGGGSGRTADLAVPLAPAVPNDRAADAIAWLLGEYQAAGTGISFGRYIRQESDRLTEALANLLHSNNLPLRSPSVRR
ncbi:MAG: nitrite/sulfite reductase [Candidatus Abyssobacteria bacterium SURF_5]|uniref:Nitrite/sulfite reductase n=1 Tax=Abyssobacteria bacterium (strain SURF_5) TaxID=2093360 RepID=A0A3A4NFK6_ABYX5|nr:MAG: nitrite/sulfite reductase [Candidatus Abyssubacteria bacterium SURF_5]